MGHKFVTVTFCGITQTVPEAELPTYTRAGYKVVEEKQPDPLTDLPEVIENEPAPVEKKYKK